MAITKLHYKQRLLRLVKFLRKLPPEKFYFGNFVTSADENMCGTVCCAIGWMPKIDPKNWVWRRIRNGPILPRGRKYNTIEHFYNHITEYFGLGYHQVRMLFYPAEQRPSDIAAGYKELYSRSTANEVADNIEHFVELNYEKADGK